MNIKKLPLTKTQRTYEFFEEKGPSCFNLCNGFVLNGKYDIEKMTKAVKKLYEKHDVLRMVMKKDQHGPYQMLNENIDGRLDIIELISEGKENRHNEAMNDARMRVREDIAFSDRGMYRFYGYEVADDEFILVYIANHSGTDGISMAMLNGELELLYENPDRTDLPQSSSFAEFLLEKAAFINSVEYKQDGKYWEKLKENCEIVEIPLPQKKYKDAVAMELGAYTIPLDKINKIARLSKTSNFNVVFLLFRIAIFELTKKKDISMTYIFASRMNPKYQGTFGFIAQGAISRTKIKDSLTWKETLKKVKEGLNESFGHINSSESVEFDEFVLSYIPKTRPTVKTNFADLQSTPFILHPVGQFGGKLFGMIATEINDILYLYPMCDVNFYGLEFIQSFNGIMNRYVNLLTENPDITIRELIQ